MQYIFFILGCVLILFVVSLTVQCLRIEKGLSQIAVLIEEKVARMFRTGKK